MGFDLAFIEKAIMIAGKPKVRFWLHDFFSVCPGYLLLRNNIEFCGAPDVSSNAAAYVCMEQTVGNISIDLKDSFLKIR